MSLVVFTTTIRAKNRYLIKKSVIVPVGAVNSLNRESFGLFVKESGRLFGASFMTRRGLHWRANRAVSLVSSNIRAGW